ncbi:MAG: transketolase [Desulfobacterales bacterium]|nr:transketolase [Desulfobacterales bacterium]
MGGLGKRSINIRKNIMQMVRHGRRGHVPSALSIVEILLVLYDHIMRYKADDPDWPGRDRFILSKGHGCLALYAILGDKGFFPKSEWKGFCTLDGILGGHPTKEKIPGVEASTGSLGHGLSIGVGLALAAKLDNKDYRTFVLLGDGECNEGSVWEAAMGAAKHELNNLVVLVDYNKHQSYSATREICDLEPFLDKWKAFGFMVNEVDMVKDPEALKARLSRVPYSNSRKPLVVICHTVKGMGVPFLENNLSWHHKSSISDEDIDRILVALGG